MKTWPVATDVLALQVSFGDQTSNPIPSYSIGYESNRMALCLQQSQGISANAESAESFGASCWLPPRC